MRARVSDHGVDPQFLSNLIKKIGQHRDLKAFFELYAATRIKMRKTATAIVRSSSEVDDILQDGYMKIWRRAETFDERKASAIAWMSAIIRNTAIDVTRSRKPPTVNLDEAPDLPAETHDPTDDMEFRATQHVVMRAFARLPADRQHLVKQAYFYGTSRAELARQYDVPESTIKTWLRRSLAIIRNSLPAGEYARRKAYQ